MKPQMVPYVFEDINLLKMMGAKSTECSPGYTQRYDHQAIPLTALEELARHIKLSDLDLKPNNDKLESVDSMTENNEKLDMDKIKELLEKKNVNMNDVDFNNLNLEKIKTMLENKGDEKVE
jgi:hypothetical protein